MNITNVSRKNHYRLYPLMPVIFCFSLILTGCEKQISDGNVNLEGSWQLFEIYDGGNDWTKTESPVYRLNFLEDGIYFISVSDTMICIGSYCRTNNTQIHFNPQNCNLLRMESDEVIKTLTMDTLVITNTSIPILSHVQLEKYFRIR